MKKHILAMLSAATLVLTPVFNTVAPLIPATAEGNSEADNSLYSRSI